MPRSSTPSGPPSTARASPWRPGPGASPLTLSLAALFILPFVVIGLSMLLFGTGATVVDWARAQSWRATPAVVESVATLWEPYPKGRGGYRVEVSYRYEVEGKAYQGHRASFHSGSDTVFQKQLGDGLEAAQRSGTPVQVWVNPAQPAESVADRSLSLESLALNAVIGLGFTGVGLGFWWVLLLSWRSLRLARKAADADPGQGAERQSPASHRKPFG